MSILSKVSYIDRNSEKISPTEIQINDGREKNFSLDKDGFELTTIPSNVKDWSEEEIQNVYYDELMDFCLEYTGCDVVTSWTHMVRRSNINPDVDRLRGPIRMAHSDFHIEYMDVAIHDHDNWPDHVSSMKSKSRKGYTSKNLKYSECKKYSILQFWRNIGPPKMNMPLGFIDPKTLDVENDVYLINPGASIKGQKPWRTAWWHPNENHMWYYWPEMQENEILVFKTLDSENHRYVPHAAFKDRRYEEERVSVELRVHCWSF